MIARIIYSIGLLMCAFVSSVAANTFPMEDMKKYHGDVKSILEHSVMIYSRDDIARETKRVAQEITEVVSDKNPIIISTLIGGMMFSSAISEHLRFPLEMDYINVSRYDGETNPSNNVDFIVKPKKSLKNRVVVVVDDILDGGITMAEVSKFCKNSGATEVYTAVMTQKNRKRDSGGLKSADFIAFNAGNEFLVGFGLDYKGYLRNLPEIYSVQS
ncbi:MAG: hypoxanthine-guanine phosphoribosyltransferase [Francisellaceae bacterium]|jgi:hypoxanthine phosphoribosyltransferase|nr:hypoxanthine-guanine phosphoribosyltransferase [Francisellaceae bacterium]MBT6207558.1 hypoxanthine-guanine phosphoribosyltransferase [Francisellaceae bacterium]MBT6538537.1 hypoxanthine-guanine phosphoribosyltransferase [Francisellaceae bacterium]